MFVWTRNKKKKTNHFLCVWNFESFPRKPNGIVILSSNPRLSYDTKEEEDDADNEKEEEEEEEEEEVEEEGTRQ